jgi:hypothetical protein
VKNVCVISVILAGIFCVGIGFSAEEADTSIPAASTGVVQEGASTAVKPYSQEVGIKLKRAVVNLARSGTEFYVQPLEARRQSGKAIAMVWPGMGEACGMFLTRLFGGCIEGATFAIPFPNGWKPLLDE